ncbi:hypothetical protein [Bacteroides thetaiotaomicron]|uniref:hypothetical protein n=1 Tax=Bacteroides thetaiotaomicron TaxID=818 RepID=UPI001897C6B9|nr:hypothetical protein [Bacteroides thetaiotaomicron]MDC2169742.1 hypothetical protein [Bacteroides thetaiotaomicron]
MKLKNATLLAIIGVSTLAILRVYTIIRFADIMELDDIKYIAPEVISFIGLLLVIPFLVVLYKKQK